MNVIGKAWQVLNTPIVFKSSKNETKSVGSYNIWDLIDRNGFSRVSALLSLQYYEQIAPVGTGVDLITDELPSLELSVFDKSDKRYETDGQEILDLLANPNAGTTGHEFIKSYSTYYTVTGEVFLMATGNPARAPLEIFIIPPQFTNDTPGADGLPWSYTVTNGGVPTVFTRKEVNGRMRFFDETGERELWHVKDFNPNASSSNHRGQSRLNSVYYEIEQHLEASRHNLALLQNGGRISMALTTDNVLEDDIFMRVKEQADRFFAGSSNAGRIFIGEGGLKVQEMGKSNRDMDFRNLKKDDATAIFNRLKIPLPLVNPDNMTLANLESARLMLYDNAVLPLCRRLLSELTLFLGDRYKLSNTQSLSIDPESIPALQTRQLQELKTKKELGVLSTNEIRAEIGREEAEGGDAILAPATMVPIAQDRFTEDNRDEPSGREKFFEIMRCQKTSDGNQRYSEKQIKEFADKEEL